MAMVYLSASIQDFWVVVESIMSFESASRDGLNTFLILERKEILRHLRRSCRSTGHVQPQPKQVLHQPVVLHNKRGKLETLTIRFVSLYLTTRLFLAVM